MFTGVLSIHETFFFHKFPTKTFYNYNVASVFYPVQTNKILNDFLC